MITALIAQVEADVANLTARLRTYSPDQKPELLRAALRERTELLHELRTDLSRLIWM